MQWLSEPTHHLVTWGSEDYPDLLSDIASPPAALFVAGDPAALAQPQVAMVGSRNPTRDGIDNAREFSAEFARRGFVVTSGLASGIDSACHDAAMDAGGLTIAVTGTGLDLVYPASSRQRARRIEDHGALVSEFPPGTGARAEHFPSRNRIISGLSLGVLVVEAGLNSGSLITARLASDQGRDVFALPGSIHNPMAKGCHRLIREGSRLVETVDEIIEGMTPMAGELARRLQDRLSQNQLTPDPGPENTLSTDRKPPVDKCRSAPKMASLQRANSAPPKTGPETFDSDYRRLLDEMGFDPKPVDRLVEHSGLTAREVSAMLLMLELKGVVEPHPGGAYSRKR
ncbi:MAG: DNA-processing protein DprA [Xanthomonadales bacterium]|nr:DNA-processing protein DprA [Xanthomonadales bacterium]